MACVAKYSEDDSWYRGMIEATNGPSCTVSFVDYGNSEDISVEDIYPANDSIADIPVQAFKCSLLGIVPTGRFITVSVRTFLVRQLVVVKKVRIYYNVCSTAIHCFLC